MNLQKNESPNRTIDMYLPEEPLHCAQCGDVMIKGRIEPWVNAYYPDGRPNGATQHTLMCKKQSTWWKRLTNWSYHEEFLVVDHPQGYGPFGTGPHRSILQTIRKI